MSMRWMSTRSEPADQTGRADKAGQAGQSERRRRRRSVRLAAWCAGGLAVVGGLSAVTAMGAPPSNLRPIPRIVGGGTVPGGMFPFMVALQQWQGTGYLTICGGTLVAPDRVLTAAHCVDQWTVGGTTNGSPNDRLVVGLTSLSASDGQTRLPTSIQVDRTWDSATESDDAAVIRLDAPVNGIASPTLPLAGDRSHEPVGVSALAMGWGSTQAEAPTDFSPGVYPDALRDVSLPLVSDSACQGVFDGVHNPAVYPRVMMCAGGDGTHDACTGDSGGPLLDRLPGGGWELIGVTSWGDGCAVPGTPGVFTRLSAPEIHDFVAGAATGAYFGP